MLEPIDLNIDLGTLTKQASTTIDDLPTVIMTHIVGLAEGANPYILTPVSHGFMTDPQGRAQLAAHRGRHRAD